MQLTSSYELCFLVIYDSAKFSNGNDYCGRIRVGAKRCDNAKQYGLIGIGLALAFALLYSILLYFFDDQIASIYTTDAKVHHLAKEFLIFAILFQISDAIATPVQGALRGYKRCKCCSNYDFNCLLDNRSTTRLHISDVYRMGRERLLDRSYYRSSIWRCLPTYPSFSSTTKIYNTKQPLIIKRLFSFIFFSCNV